MNTKEALALLKSEGVTSSTQMLHRWIRQGKIEAELTSKKEGYVINRESLEAFIQQKKNEAPPVKKDEFNQGWHLGFASCANQALYTIYDIDKSQVQKFAEKIGVTHDEIYLVDLSDDIYFEEAISKSSSYWKKKD